MTSKQLAAIKKLYTTITGRLIISTHNNSETMHPAVAASLYDMGFVRIEHDWVGGKVMRFATVSNRICPEAEHLRSSSYLNVK